MVANVRISGQQSFPYSESDIRVNYLNQNQVIAGANANITTSGSQGQFFSSNGGRTWGQTSLPLDSGDNFQSDPAVDWTSDGTAWALTIGFDAAQTHLRVEAFKSSDGGATWTPDGVVSGSHTAADKDMVWVDHSPTSPFRDNIYAIWHNNGPAFVNRRTGPSGSWQTPVQVSGAETTGTGIGGDVKTNSNGDVFAFWPDTGSQGLFVAKSVDGGATFAAPVSIATTFGSFQLAVPANADRQALIYISGGCYRTAALDLVYAMWNDLSGEAGCTSGFGPGGVVTSPCKSRIWFARSLDGGATWQPSAMINNQASLNDQFFPRICADETNGDLVAVYYDTVGDPGRLKTDIWTQRSADNGATWSVATKVTTAQTDETSSGADLPGGSFFGDQYGDYIGLTGYAGTFFPCWTDRRNGAREEIWTAPLTTPACQFIVDRSTFGQDEVAAKLPNAQFAPAFWVAVSGFTPNDLGLNSGNLASPPSIPAIASAFDPLLTAAESVAIQGMFSISFAGPVVPQDPSLPDWPQIFLFPFNVDFSNQAGFQAMAAGQPPVATTLITLTASFNPGTPVLPAQTQLELTTGEDPYFIDVDPANPAQPSWLSFDLRFFKAVQGQSRFGVGNLNTPADAPTFIANVIGNLNTPGANLGSDSFDGLTQDEDQSALEFQQQVNGQFVFNFAVARVRLLGKNQATAQATRVFFRLFQAQNTASDFNVGTTYRFASDGQTYGHAIPLLGVQNDQNGNPEYVTLPCFASPRINLQGPADMTAQDDSPNLINIATNPGVEVDTYFGCWLDINQPDQMLFPLTPPPGDFDGKNGWQGVPLHSIQEAIIAAPHQCLIAEIRFDDTPIPTGATSGTSDKLAQRNIAWIDGPNPGVADSRRMPHPVQIRPTPSGATNPDELLIFWGGTPQASEAELFLPMFLASDIIKLAGRLYTGHRLRVRDAHTIVFPAHGATFVPIPSGVGLAAGLLTIDLPPGIRKGDFYAIMVRQLTDESGVPPSPPIQIQVQRQAAQAAAQDTVAWRGVLGAFQFGINISTKQQILLPEERLLAVLRWIELVMPKQKRWYPVLQRYIGQVAGRVGGFGGDPGAIKASPTGQVPGLPKGGPPEPTHGDEGDLEEACGKIDGIIFDHFGDFRGFILETEHGHHRRFVSGEAPMLALVRRAWHERSRVAVLFRHARPHIPVEIILRSGGPVLWADE